MVTMEQFKKVLEVFETQTYSDLIKTAKGNPGFRLKEDVIHCLLFLEIKKQMPNCQVVMEKSETFVIEGEERKLSVDLCIDNEFYIEIKLKNNKDLFNKDIPEVRDSNGKLKYIGDDRKLKYLLNKGLLGVQINFSKESSNYHIIPYIDLV